MSNGDPEQTGAQFVGGADRRKPDRAHIQLQRQIDALKAGFNAHGASIGELRTLIHDENQDILAAIDKNTILTRTIDTRLDQKTAYLEGKIDAHTEATKDVLRAYGRVQMVGKIVDMFRRLGSWMLEHWKPLLICAVGLRVAFKGGTFAESWDQLMKFIKD